LGIGSCFSPGSFCPWLSFSYFTISTVPGMAYTVIPVYGMTPPHTHTHRHTDTAFVCWDMGLTNFFIQAAWNLDPPDLSLSSS
jgi:hypothetical protein